MIVKLGDIARECKCTTGNKDCPIVGLEHLEPKELLLKNYSSDPNTTFTKSFKAGQILFGRRRSYQQKASVATFDGICSGDIIVIEAIPEKVEPRLLPFIIQNEAFFNYSIIGSAGGLSPRVKWQHLANYEFELPSLEEQRVLADKLWAAYEVKESYKNLLAQTDKLLHAQFEKMFGEETLYRKIEDLFSLQMGKTPSRDIPSYFKEEGHTWLSIADIKEHVMYTSSSKEKLSDAAIKECGIKIVPRNTVIMSFKLTVGRLAITTEDLYTNEAIMAFLPKDSTYRTKFVYYLFQHVQWLGDAKLAVKGNTLNKESISNKLIPVIDIDKQDKFLVVAEQAERTKASLNKGIEAIEAVIRSLIAEGTTKV